MRRKTWALLLILKELRDHRIRSLAVALVTLACVAQPTSAQESGKVVVPLQINRPYEQRFVVAWVEFDGDSLGPGTKRGTIRHGLLPGGLRIAIETITESPKVYSVSVDTDGDGELADESPLLLNLDSTVTVKRIADKRQPAFGNESHR